jgi:hypothetical protein
LLADDGADGVYAWRVRAQTVEVLREVQAGAAPSGSADVIERANRLIAAYVREILGKDLPSFGSVFADEPGN